MSSAVTSLNDVSIKLLEYTDSSEVFGLNSGLSSTFSRLQLDEMQTTLVASRRQRS